METQVTQTESGDTIVFRVRSSTPSTDLGSAIAHAVMGGRKVEMRAVGAGAVNQAIKAIPIAKSYVIGFGAEIVMDVNNFHGHSADGDIIGIAIPVMRR